MHIPGRTLFLPACPHSCLSCLWASGGSERDPHPECTPSEVGRENNSRHLAGPAFWELQAWATITPGRATPPPAFISPPPECISYVPASALCLPKLLFINTDQNIPLPAETHMATALPSHALPSTNSHALFAAVKAVLTHILTANTAVPRCLEPGPPSRTRVPCGFFSRGLIAGAHTHGPGQPTTHSAL